MSSLIRSNVVAYRRRYSAVIAAIAIGVAFLTATLLVNSTVQATLNASIGQSYAKADLVSDISSSDEDSSEKPPTSPEKVVNAVKETDGVKSALVSASTFNELSTPKGSAFAEISVSSGDMDLAGQDLVQGNWPGKNGIVVDRTMAKDQNLKIGSSLAISNYLGDSDKPVKHTLKVTGVQAGSDSPMNAGTATAVITAPTATALHLETNLSQVLVTTNASQGGVGDRLQHTLEQQGLDGVTVMTPDQMTTHKVSDLTGGTAILTIILGLFAAIALVVTVLVVANTFTVVLAQRTRELALLRTLGAKRGQIRRMVTGESLLVGLVGSIIGIVLAVAILWVGTAVLRPVLDLPYLTFGMSWSAIVIGLIVGLLVTWLASLRPARSATRVAPLAALQPQETVTVSSKRGRGRIVFGIILVIIGAVLLGAGVTGAAGDQLSVIVAFFGGLLSFIGVLMLGTFLIPWAVRMLAKAFGSNVSGRLAGLNALRHPQRTSAIGTALLLGVTLVCMMAAGASSARSTLNHELAQHYPLDLAVSTQQDQSDGSTSGSGNSKQLTRQDAAAAAKLHGVKHSAHAPVVAVAGTCGSSDDPADSDQECYPVYALDHDQLVQTFTDGARLPAEGKVALGSMAYSSEKKPTAVIVFDANGTKHRVAVDQHAVSNNEYSVLLDTQTAKKFGLSSASPQQRHEANAADQVWLHAAADVDAQDLIKDVTRVTGTSESNVDGALPIRQSMGQVIDGLLWIVSALLAVAVIIALIGVSNTLSLSVIERTRENSLLRALGLKKKQLRGMLALEAGLIAGASAILGIILGTLYGLAGSKSALMAVGTFSLSVPWVWLVVVLVVAVGAAVLASLWPARRAARLSPVEGLATE